MKRVSKCYWESRSVAQQYLDDRSDKGREYVKSECPKVGVK